MYVQAARVYYVCTCRILPGPFSGFHTGFSAGGNLTSTISCIQKLMYTNPKLHHLSGGIYVGKEVPKAAF